MEAAVSRVACLIRVGGRDHGLLEVPAFRLDLTLTPWKRGGVKVEGKVTADVVQQCIISLDPMPAHLDVPVEALFVPEGSRIAMPAHLAGSELVIDPDGDDGPETFSGDHIDVGALAEQFFSLALDPYPRKTGVGLPAGGGADDEKRGPLYDKLKGLAGKH